MQFPNPSRAVRCITLFLLTFLSISGLLGGAGGSEAASADQGPYHPATSNRTELNLDSSWRFHLGDVSGAQEPGFDDSGWTKLDLPHTWNNQDGQDGGNNYYRGSGWYRKHYTVAAALGGRRFYLQFNGANLVTDVYVNGSFVGEHQGGYAIFRFDVTPYLKVGADNVIAVKVNNAYNADIPPLSADYTFFGGIYRDVYLLATDPVHLSMTDYGSSGVYLTQGNVSATSADLQVTAKTVNDASTQQNIIVRTTIVDAQQRVVRTLVSQQVVAAHSEYDFVQQTTISHPHLWDGRKDPYLYHAYVQVQVGGRVADLVSQPLGFRFFRLDPNQGFFLNGHYLDLHGVNMHQDRLNKGWAVSQQDLAQDFSFVKEIGATAIRLAHYQHDQLIYDLCDETGVVAWAEIPVINNVTADDAFTSNAKQQLIELIRQNYNHPSIIFWSVGNEIHRTPDPNSYIAQANALAHQEDPTRLTTLAVCCVSETDPIALHTDTRGYNEYFGWYSGNYTDFDSWASNLHANHPDLSFAVSEYGAGASIYQHQDDPPKPVTTGYFHPEEYQATLHEAIWQSMENKPYIWGKFIWNLFDFASDGRNEGDTAGRNDKGIVTYDRQTRKDAFYWYKANWSSDPFVYITDRRYTQRTLATTDIKIYSNTTSVELFVNGVSLGSRTSNNHIFLWKGVALLPGNNVVRAVGTLNGQSYSDAVNWNYTPNTFLNAGARLPYTDGAGNYYDVDHYVNAGQVNATTHTIANTSDQAEYQSYRFGTFSYAIPLENGTYRVTLKFMEPYLTACGQRVFDVSVQGTKVLQNEDIYCEVGQYAALQKTFTATVNNGVLTIAFTPSVNNAIVSAIAIVKQ